MINGLPKERTILGPNKTPKMKPGGFAIFGLSVCGNLLPFS